MEVEGESNSCDINWFKAMNKDREQREHREEKPKTRDSEEKSIKTESQDDPQHKAASRNP